VTCVQPFRRLVIERTTNSGVRVWWELSSDFFDPAPHTYQLQHSYSGLINAVDWTDVGQPAVDAIVLHDDTVREQGKILLSHYRLVLVTPLGTYESASTGCRSGIDLKSWLLAKEIFRKESLRFKRARSGVLFKRRRYGQRCACLNTLTGEVQDSNCGICLGTGFVGGYHKPFHCLPFEIPEESISENQIPVAGTSRNDTLQARVLGNPMLQRLDVIADANSDERWHVQDVKIAAAVGNLPIVLMVTLLPLPFSHIVYTLGD
jgi:hypothetical protein